VFALAACVDSTPVTTGDVPCVDGAVADDSTGECVPESCGAGRWGAIEHADVFVDAAATDGGNGGVGVPLRAIRPALDLAGEAGGGTVSVAAAHYVESLVFGAQHDGVRLVGRCHPPPAHLNKVPISQLCEENDLQPSLLYYWQRLFFENAVNALQPPVTVPSKAMEARVEALESVGAHEGARESDTCRERYP